MDVSAPPRRRAVPSTPRRLANCLVLGVCLLLLVRVFGAEPYGVPTGSMVPTILGHHRAGRCPRCGAEVRVGRHPADPGDGRPCRGYERAWCPNCGCDRLGLEDVPEAAGDHLLVSKTAFAFRQPRRWELAVFRLLGKMFIKRVIGLPGELLEILDGDIYVDGQLARKTLDECREQRILVFDNNCQPGPDGWRARWEVPASQPGPHPLRGAELHLDGTADPARYCLAGYLHYLLDEKHSRPVRDEYSYNAAQRQESVPVHDFLLECDVEVGSGQGHLLLGLTDGLDTILAEVPVCAAGAGELALVLRAPSEAEVHTLGRPSTNPGAVHALTRTTALQPGRTYHLEMAFVDRRVTLAVDGGCPLPAVDLAPARGRLGVERPVLLGARGVKGVVRNFRLFRDVHYTQAGRNGVGGKAVHLGPGQYFVLGDNSPGSDDSRFWPGGGAVDEGRLVGKPFLLHLPSRLVTWEAFGRPWQARVPDWARVRWLR
jgi:signal peptidase I